MYACDRTTCPIAVRRRWPRWRSTIAGPSGWSRCATSPAPTGSARTCSGSSRPPRGSGFSAKGVKGPYEALPQVPLPAIAHVKTEEGLGHFVVLHRVQKGSVVVADPARGVQTLTRDEFCRRWTGYLLLVVPGAANARPAHAERRAGLPRGVDSSACSAPTPPSSSRPSSAPCS